MADKTKVTRIKATDNTSSKASTRAKAAKPAEVVSSKVTKKAPKNTTKATKVAAAPIEAKKNIFSRIGGYFKGAWIELKQVRWPTRKATWSLTLAVLLFSAFFVVLILLLDALFQFVFQTIIG